jgi:carboxymethylenebutenolidase
VEIYPGTHHGFAFPQRPVYNKPAAERHWERLFQLFGTALAPLTNTSWTALS